MTHKQKINYMRIATNLAQFGFTNAQLDLLVSLYDLTIEKKGDTTVDDIIQVKYDVEERNLPEKLFSSLEELEAEIKLDREDRPLPFDEEE